MDSIKNAYLYCANFRQMNDPMEGFYSESKLLEKSSDIEGFRRALRAGKIMIGICAFSEVFNHELMWAHYADQFRGVCIAYDFYRLRRHLPDGVSFSRLYYNEEVPKVGLSKNPRDDKETAKTILSFKNYRWLYEREWRLFADIGLAFYNEPRCIARVYIGSRVAEKHRNRIERELKQLKIPCQVQKLDGYEMRFERGTKAK
jgi:hypothetical protein